MNKSGCQILGLLVSCGLVSGGINQRQLAYGQVSGVVYGDYVTVGSPLPESTASEPMVEFLGSGDRTKSIPEPPSSPWESQALPESPPPAIPQPVEPEPLPSPAQKPAASYFGIGGTIGLSEGKTALGEGGFSLVSKTAFTPNLSLHNTTTFGSQTASMFALTGEIPIKNERNQAVVAIPFLGGGTLLTTKDEWNFHGLVVGGVDVPLSHQWMGTVRVNTGLVDGKTEVGVIVGLGYRFSVWDLWRRQQ